jgi:glutamate dehydrogenase
VAPEDLLDRDPVEVAGPATSHRRFAGYRPQGRALVRAFTPSAGDDRWDVGRSVV